MCNSYFMFADKCAAKFKFTELYNSTMKLVLESHDVEGRFGRAVKSILHDISTRILWIFGIPLRVTQS
jgi:hypothetical protein